MNHSRDLMLGRITLNNKISTSLHLLKTIKKIEKEISSDESLSGIATGFKKLDIALSGLQRGSLIFVAGLPSVGKSAFSTNLTYNVACSERRVLFFSLKNTTDLIVKRMISLSTKIPVNLLELNTVEFKKFSNIKKAISEVKKLSVDIVDNGNLTIDEIVQISADQQSSGELDLIIVDGFNLLLNKSDGSLDAGEQEVSELTVRLKKLAKSLDIAIVVTTSFPSRDTIDKGERALLSDLAPWHGIEQNSDCVIILNHPHTFLKWPEQSKCESDERYNKRINTHALLLSETVDLMELSILKNRCHDIASVDLRFEKDFGLFSDFDD